MVAIINLTALKTKFENAIRVDTPTLDSILMVDVPFIAAFIETLPDPKIVLTNLSLELNSDAEPPLLLLSGYINETWPVRGVNGPGIYLGNVTIRLTQVNDTAPILSALYIDEAQLNIASQNIALNGHLYTGNVLRLKLAEATPPQIPLPSLILMISQGGLTSSVPVEEDFFKNDVPLSELSLYVGFKLDSNVKIRVGCAINTNWNIIPDVLAINKVGLGFENNYFQWPNGAPGYSTSGVILGTIQLVKEFDVHMTLGHDNQQIYVKPAAGELPPTLGDMAKFAGGTALRDSVNGGLALLGIETPAVEQVQIAFSLRRRKLNLIFIRGSLRLAGALFRVDVHLPDFYISGQMLIGQKISLKALMSQYFTDTEQMPEIEVNYLRLSAYPGAGVYEMQAALDTDWLVDLGTGASLALKNVELQMERAPVSTTGFLKAQLNIAGADFLLQAEKPGSDTGWQFRGYVLSDQGVKVESILGAFGDLFGLDTQKLALPDSIRGLEFRNPGMIFNVKKKDFAFTCEVALPIADRNSYPEGDIVILLQLAFDGKTKKTVFGWSIVTINLSNLPVLKERLTLKQKLALNSMKMYYASAAFANAELTTLNLLLSAYSGAPALDKLRKGLSFSAELYIDGATNRFQVPVSDTGQLGAPQPGTPIVTQTDGTLWYPIGKKIGPATFERIGVSYKDGAVALYLDAALQTGPLEISLLGLTVSIPLDSFSPRFNVQGLGLAYDDPRAEIGGSFLKGSLDYEGKTYTAFSGGAYLKLPAPGESGAGGTKKAGLTLSAMGSYILMDDPSLLVYAMLDKPIGGPPFFFVTGLAAGFGYNRRLNLPPLYRLPEFPLISAALNPSSSSSDIAIEMRKLAPYIPPARGEFFLAIGVKATTFKLVESFALLILSVADEVRFDIIGTSRVRLPPLPPPGVIPAPELVRLDVAFKASFDPGKGFLGLQGQLTPNSFLLSQNCRIAGGFAFFSWMSGTHAGDFVQTLGGYHPAFKRPGHYPMVPRAAFNWRVNSKIYIKGSLYYALTPTAIMAGGHLEAVYQAGNFKAWYRQGVDFLINWKPLTYDARSRINIGASYTFKVFGIRCRASADVGAHLHIWGPEFSGRAVVNLVLFSFTIRFGKNKPARIRFIAWDEFRNSFLPADHEICSLSVMDGLVTRASNAITTDLGTLNPKTFALAASSAIPAKEGTASPSFGIAPMGKSSNQVTANLAVIITSEGVDVSDRFALTPVYKNIPKGLWGTTPAKQGINAPQLIEKVLCGYEIRPASMPKSDVSPAMPVAELLMELSEIQNAFNWQALSARKDQDILDESTRESRINDSILAKATSDNRLGVLQSLGIDEPELQLSTNLGGAFVFSPRIENVA